VENALVSHIWDRLIKLYHDRCEKDHTDECRWKAVLTGDVDGEPAVMLRIWRDRRLIYPDDPYNEPAIYLTLALHGDTADCCCVDYKASRRIDLKDPNSIEQIFDWLKERGVIKPGVMLPHRIGPKNRTVRHAASYKYPTRRSPG